MSKKFDEVRVYTTDSVIYPAKNKQAIIDEWTDALMNALGDCLDISESLVEEGTYTVYSHDFESEDTYHTETTSEGFIVN